MSQESSVKESSVNLMDLSKQNNAKNIIQFYGNGKTIKSRDAKGNGIIFRSPILKVVRPPQERRGRSNEFSIGVSLFENTPPKIVKQFKDLIDETTNNAIKFLLKNGKEITGKDFKSENDFKISNFWYNDTTFYMSFNNNIPSYFYDTSNLDVIKDNVCNYLGVGSLITVDLKHSIFYYNKNNTLYPFSLNISKLVVWKKSNDLTLKKSSKRHGWLNEPSFTIPNEYKLSNLTIQSEVPVHNINDFDINKFSLSKVIEGEKGNNIYATYEGSYGPVYFEASNIVVKYDITKDPTYDSRTISIVDSIENRSIFTAVKQQYSKLITVVTENSEKIFGETYDRETVEGLISNPLYSQNDSEKKNARLSLKLPRESGDKPMFRLFSMNSDKTIGEVKMGETCDEAEKYISAGTVLKSIVFLVKPSIVNSQVYLSLRTSQILVNKDQKKIFIPSVNGFAFPSYEKANVDNRSSSVALKLTNDNYSFGDYNKERKTFYLNVEQDGVKTDLIVLPQPITVSFQVDIKDDPENNKYAFRVRYNYTDTKVLELFRDIDKSLVTYCTDNSKVIFGSKKSPKIIEASAKKGKLEKYSKKDTDNKYPYGTLKLPVYNNNGKEFIGFEVYRSISPITKSGLTTIQKVELNSTEDLQTIFRGGSKLLPIVKMKGSRVDMRLSLSVVGQQFLIVNDDETLNIPFEDNFNLTGVDLSGINTSFEKVQEEKVQEETVQEETVQEEKVQEETVQETPEPTMNTNNNPEVESDDSSSESEEESVSE